MAEKKAAKKPAAKKPVVKVVQAAERPLVPIVNEVHVYRDRLGEWRWRALAGNNKIVATSSEGYNNRMYCHKIARGLYPTVSIWFV